MSRRTPPRRIESLLERLVGAGLAGQGVLGDLAEAYHRMRARRPAWRCDLWYAWQAATVVWYRLAGRGGGEERGGLRPGGSGVGADVRWALRLAARRPLFTAGVAVTLGLGLGATTAVFSVAHGTFRATSWWEEPDRVLSLWPGRPFSRGELSILQEEATATFEAVGAYRLEAFAVARSDAETESVEGVFISPELFDRLRVQPALGRGFAPEDGVPDAEPTVVLSRRFWIRSLGGDPAVVGRRLPVNGQLRTVIGIQGEGGSAPGAGTDAWLPLVLDPRDPDFFPAYELDIVGVPRPGAGALQAQEAVREFGRGMAARFSFFYPPDFGGDATVRPAAEEQRATLRTPLALLLGATALLLVVAALNAANMLLARALERSREIAVRRALGASRGRVVRQLAVESSLLVTFGALVGVTLATPASRLLVGLWAADAPVARSAWATPAVAAFLALAAVVAWLLLAGLPVLHFVSTDRKGVRANAAAGGGRGRRLLVGTQAALATVLLTAAALLVGTVGALRRIPLGFDPASVVTFRLSPPADLLTDPGRLRRLQEDVVQRVQGITGVEVAGLAGVPPLGGVPLYIPVNAEDRPVDVARAPRVALNAVDPGFFGALRVPLLGGRLLDPSDRWRGVSAVVVNRALAETLWPGEDPVGKRIAIDPHAWTSWVTVVGEVGDVRSEGLVQPPGPALYVSLAERIERETTLLVRGGPDVGTLAAEVRRIVRDVDPVVPVGAVRPLDLVVRGAYGTAWVTMGLLGILALLATTLAALGIHAALSHDVALRRREIAVRLALGAGRGAVIARVLAVGMAPTATGVAVGLVAAALAGRVLDGLLFGVSRLEPSVFAATGVAVLAAALAAAAVPALGVAALPPADALREE